MQIARWASIEYKVGKTILTASRVAYLPIIPRAKGMDEFFDYIDFRLWFCEYLKD
jgi:hypothetical protein